MARGPSGRIVIEIEPALKRELHSALVADGETLKDWFIGQARHFLRERNQPGLPGLVHFQPSDTTRAALVAEEEVAYRTRASPPAPPLRPETRSETLSDE